MPSQNSNTFTTDNLLRVPPHSIEAERSVLACALTDEKLLSRVITEVKLDDFYDPVHKLIFQAIFDLINEQKAVDIITVMDKLSLKGKLEDIGGLPFLNGLLDAAPALTNVSHYTNIVHQKSLMRKLILALNDSLATCYKVEKADDVLDYISNNIFDLREVEKYGNIERLGEVVTSIINDIFQQFEKKESRRGISSGFPSLDIPLSGLRAGTLNILAARPAMGKSALAINIAHRVASSGKVVAFFSLEMSKEEIAYRVLSSQAFISSNKLSQASELNEKDFDDIGIAMRKLFNIGFYIDDKADNSPVQILSKCRQMKIEGHDLGLVIVDYMQLMRPDGRHDSRQQEISEISRGLKLLAKELNIPVIALSQLSRACEMRQNKRPMLSDLRESGSIEQDADAVLFIYRDSYYQNDREEGPREEAEVIIAKNRSGSTQTIKLEWLSSYTTFYDPASKRISDEDAPPENIGKLSDNLDYNPFDDDNSFNNSSISDSIENKTGFSSNKEIDNSNINLDDSDNFYNDEQANTDYSDDPNSVFDNMNTAAPWDEPKQNMELPDDWGFPGDNDLPF